MTEAEARFEAICDELAELCGQQNAIAGRITELLAEVDSAELLAGTGVRSLEHFCTWRLGVSAGRARTLTTIARRRADLPETVGLLDSGQLSADQAGVIARRAPSNTDEHYAGLARSATVGQLQRALRAAPPVDPTPPVPDDGTTEPSPPAPEPEPRRDVRAGFDDLDEWVLTARVDRIAGATIDAALRSHLDALVHQWRRDHGEAGSDQLERPPFPTLADALVRMAEHSLDAEAHIRPHGHRTTVVVHLDVAARAASLHLGPALTEAERRYLTCDSRVEIWFERDGRPIGVGRETRSLPRRLRRALEHRAAGCCEIPGCGASTGLHAHHLRHWEDGGPTELSNLLLVCPFHHRLHHRGIITIRGPAHALHVIDRHGRVLTSGGLARPPTTGPPTTEPYRHPTGERMGWRWYDPPSAN